MRCDEIKRLIDQDLFEASSEKERTIQNHIQTCTSCNDYFELSKGSAKYISKLKTAEPELHNPIGLTADIMSAIENEPAQANEADTNTHKSRTLSIAVRILAAASVFLFMVLGVEQYIVLEKIQKLETSNKLASPEAKDFGIYKVVPALDNPQIASSIKIDQVIENLQNNGFRQKLLQARLNTSDIDKSELKRMASLSNLLTNNQTRILESFIQSN